MRNTLPGLLTTKAIDPYIPPCSRVTSVVVVQDDPTITGDPLSLPPSTVSDTDWNPRGVSYECVFRMYSVVREIR